MSEPKRLSAEELQQAVADVMLGKTSQPVFGHIAALEAELAAVREASGQHYDNWIYSKEKRREAEAEAARYRAHIASLLEVVGSCLMSNSHWPCQCAYCAGKAALKGGG